MNRRPADYETDLKFKKPQYIVLLPTNKTQYKRFQRLTFSDTLSKKRPAARPAGRFACDFLARRGVDRAVQ